MVSTLASRLLGFVRIGIISALFGASGQADILNLVFNIPNNLRKLLAEGALSTAFIPVLSRNLVEDPSKKQSRTIVKNLLAFQLLVLLPFLVLAAIFPSFFVSILLNFSDPEKHRLAAELFRYVIHYILFISFSAVIMGTLNSNERFVIPALTPLLFSIAVISSLLLFHRSLGIFAMAVGVIAGGIAQVLVQLPEFFHQGYSFGFNFSFNNPQFRQILKNWGPVLATSGVFAINQQIAARFASEMETGSGSAMSYAIVFWQLPFGIFSASIITVLFPRLSKQIAAGDRIETSRTVEFGIAGLMTFLIPSSLGLMMLGNELISAALQRGAFTVENTRLAAQVLFWYSPGLLFVGLNTFLQRLCYSDGDIRVPVYNALIITVLDILLSLWLKETFLRVRGLALANSISYIIASSWLLMKSRHRFPDISFKPIIRDLAKILISLIPAVLIIAGGKYLAGDYWISGSNFVNLGIFLLISLPAILSIFGMFVLLHLDAVYLVIKRKAG